MFITRMAHHEFAARNFGHPKNKSVDFQQPTKHV